MPGVASRPRQLAGQQERVWKAEAADHQNDDSFIDVQCVPIEHANHGGDDSDAIYLGHSDDEFWDVNCDP